MKVTVIGASHGLGAATVAAALEAGHQVTAFARHPERLGRTHERLQLASGDVLDPPSVAAAVEGQDAAIITLGLPTLQAMGVGRSKVLSQGTRNVIATAQSAGVRRIICETAIGTGDSKRQSSLMTRLAMRVVLRYLTREKEAQEETVRASGLEYVLVRPSALTNGPAGGEIVMDPPKVGALTPISRADVAAFMVTQLGEDTYLGKAVVVSGRNRPLLDWWRWLKDYR